MRELIAIVLFAHMCIAENINLRGKNWRTPENEGENRNVVEEMIRWKVST